MPMKFQVLRHWFRDLKGEQSGVLALLLIIIFLFPHDLCSWEWGKEIAATESSSGNSKLTWEDFPFPEYRMFTCWDTMVQKETI